MAKFFATESRAGIQAAQAERLRLILAALNAAIAPGDMGLPGLKLHPLKGGRSGTWAVRLAEIGASRSDLAARMPWTLTMRTIIEVAMRMHNPPHPGEIIRQLCLEPLGMTVTDAASALGVSRKTLSALLNGRAGISPEMAVRLSMAFGTSSESWMNQQTQYDLWHAEKRRKDLGVSRVAA